jgi:hypothetical protein
MGKTSMSGPVFGAKATLMDYTLVSAASSGAVAGTIVPPGEDWYATDLSFYRASTGLSTFAVSLVDDSTVLATVMSTAGTAGGWLGSLTPDSGEYQGVKIASGSVVTFSHNSTQTGAVTTVLSGYRRWIPSTSYTE